MCAASGFSRLTEKALQRPLLNAISLAAAPQSSTVGILPSDTLAFQAGLVPAPERPLPLLQGQPVPPRQPCEHQASGDPCGVLTAHRLSFP